MQLHLFYTPSDLAWNDSYSTEETDIYKITKSTYPNAGLAAGAGG
jgi:hypothetical protein